MSVTETCLKIYNPAFFCSFDVSSNENEGEKEEKEFVGKGNMLSYIQANTRKHLFFKFTCSIRLVQNPGVLVFQFCREVGTVSISTMLLSGISKRIRYR